MGCQLIIYGCFLRIFTVLRKSFYPQYGRACFITGIKEGMFITMFIRALTRGELIKHLVKVLLVLLLLHFVIIPSTTSTRVDNGSGVTRHRTKTRLYYIQVTDT